MCCNLNKHCESGHAQNAMATEGKEAPAGPLGSWIAGDITHPNWGSPEKRRGDLGEKVMLSGFVTLFEVLMQHPNQDFQKQLNE